MAFFIGNVKIDGQVVLAPMAGVTDAPFRSMVNRFGVSASVSEMVSSEALVRSSPKTFKRLIGDISPKIVQIMGASPENMVESARINEEMGAEIILSSTWRDLAKRKDEPEHPMYTYLTDILQEYGLKIIGHTPYIDMNRPKEIKAWLDSQPDTDIKFVSLDDDFPKHKYDEVGIGDCLVRTCFYEKNGGLRQEHVEKAVEILNLEDWNGLDN